MSARLAVSNEELVTIRDASRELGRLATEVESGAAEKFVLTKHGRMVAVLLPISAAEQCGGGGEGQ